MKNLEGYFERLDRTVESAQKKKDLRELRKKYKQIEYWEIDIRSREGSENVSAEKIIFYQTVKDFQKELFGIDKKTAE